MGGELEFTRGTRRPLGGELWFPWGGALQFPHNNTIYI